MAEINSSGQMLNSPRPILTDVDNNTVLTVAQIDDKFALAYSRGDQAYDESEVFFSVVNASDLSVVIPEQKVANGAVSTNTNLLTYDEPISGDHALGFAYYSDSSDSKEAKFAYLNFSEALNQSPQLNIVEGTDESDDLLGTVGPDSIMGYDGDDTIDGSGGDDIIDGGPGDDDIFGGEGDDIINDGTGLDNLDGGSGNDTYSRDWDLTFPDAEFVIGVDLDREGLFLVSGEDPDHREDVLVNFENVDLDGGIDSVVTGDEYANILYTDYGDDIIYGNGGDDISGKRCWR